MCTVDAFSNQFCPTLLHRCEFGFQQGRFWSRTDDETAVCRSSSVDSKEVSDDDKSCAFNNFTNLCPRMMYGQLLKTKVFNCADQKKL